MYTTQHCPEARLARALSCWRLLAVRDLDPLDVLAQQLVDQRGEIDAFGLGQRGQASLHRIVEIDRQVQLGAGAVEFAALGVGKIDFGGHVVVGWVHGVHRGVFWYWVRSRRVAGLAEITRTCALAGPVV